MMRRLFRRRPAVRVDALGFPTRRHPESMDRELPDRDETWLAALAAGLWPDDEYTEIVTGDGS
jgi:hypothetical protein